MRTISYILARFYEVRAKRALKAYQAFRVKADQFFARAGL